MKILKKAVVVNVHDSPYDVYVGRNPKYGDTKFGNPYKLKDEKGNIIRTREQAVKEFKKYFYKNLILQEQAIKELTGKVLGCHCAPELCHGDILAEFVNSKQEENSDC